MSEVKPLGLVDGWPDPLTKVIKAQARFGVALILQQLLQILIVTFDCAIEVLKHIFDGYEAFVTLVDCQKCFADDCELRLQLVSDCSVQFQNSSLKKLFVHGILKLFKFMPNFSFFV